VEVGADYYFRVDGHPDLWPDPASRFQPEGPRGYSRVVDPSGFDWHDAAWPGISPKGQVLYELHVGTFTREGTWQAAQGHLGELAELGITVVHLLPVADFEGRFGWGYDGANLFAPTRLYGTPDDFRQFVDAAHGLGIGVILDIVYNHYSSTGEALLRPFADEYFSRRYKTDWGAAVNFDGEGAAEVRAFFLANAEYWIREFHLDGYRVDATQSIEDDSPRHFLLDLTQTARAAAPHKQLLIVGENEPQRGKLVRSENAGGYELDTVWNDDFHHAAMVRLTGRREAYYTDYCGTAEEFIACARWGFLFQGQRYQWQKKGRGTPALDLRAQNFVTFLQNHDQLANSARGERIHQLASPGRFRAMTAVHLLSPQTPLLFQGQEFAASAPFLYFNDCHGEQRMQVRAGRAKFLAQFPSLATKDMQARLIDPADATTFEKSKLNHDERRLHATTYQLHRDLLRLRRDDPVLSRHDASELHGAALTPDSFFFRYLPPTGETRLLLVNLERELRFESIAHPLIAPPEGMRWALLWSSEDPAYGGGGTPELDTPDGWRIPGESAVLLSPHPNARS
jgi:maltooligosyltrehalose trehalohydrolase